jgi:hypothetical protein
MGDLREAFDRTVEANDQADAEIDAALIEAGRAVAGQVDDAIALGDLAETGKALYLIPHLMNILREMYATPKSRVEAGIGREVAGGKLAAVRELRQRPEPTKKRA